MSNSKETIDNLLNDLKHNSAFNPFHPNFNSKKIRESINTIPKGRGIINNENLYIFNLIKILPTLNQFSKDTAEQINRCIREANLDLDELQELLVILANHYYLSVQNQAKEEYKKAFNDSEYIDFGVFANIPNELSAKAETIIDTNNILSNYFKNYYQTVYKIDKTKPKNKSLTSLNKISAYTQIFSIYKTFYETCLFEKFNIEEIQLDKHLIYLANMVDTKYHLVRKISKERETKYIFTYLTCLDESPHRKKLLYEIFSHKIKNKKIAKIIFKDSKIDYILTNSSNNNLDEFFHLLCCMMPFYSFMISDKDKADLINDCIILYAKFQEFFKKVVESTNFALIEKSEDFNNIPFKINKDVLGNYLLETTNIDNVQIKKFLKVLSNTKHINFFKKPLLLKDNDYLFHFLNSTANNSVNIIDDWLEESNFNLDERGIIFENFIKNELSTIFQEKKYDYYIFNKNKFKSTICTEEIDLIIVLHDIILLGEIKCIKYPIEIRDIENANQRILEGVKQIIRKMDFVENNEELFNIDNINIKNKTVIPFVITNYPCFSGWCPNGIPILDYELLRNYIDTGALLQSKIEQGVLTEQNKKEYYTNQKEFEERFNDFLKTPEPILDISKNLELTLERPIHNPSILMLINPKIITQIYKFKNIVEKGLEKE